MKISKIEAGDFYCDGGAVFGVVPKRVWQKRYPCNDDNFCKMSMRCLLIDTGKRLVMVDTGAGTKHLEYLKYYNINKSCNFEEELNALGYSCDDLTDVVQTHLHFDHCGGGTYFADKARTVIKPTFPNATFWLSKAQWDNYLHPNVREADSFFPENMQPLMEMKRIRLIDSAFALCPEIELRLFDGHSRGQIAPYITYGDKTVVFCGDVIPLSANIPIAWVSAFDCYPVTSMIDKEQLLEEAAEHQQILVFQHDAYTECGKVSKINGRIKLTESFKISEI
ncbi:MAG: MBL fold metallo-hydrolase [Prevotellaceae bacterium]|jgi:glyoxylase-like metal-dependent hydrolase (beta-lactamase superfamily II)|nr:MBL fold metallo-hydrolase [Prevotellaceae bacterium]